MKINPYSIIRDHLSTLKDARSERISTGDLIIFYAIPFAGATVMYFTNFKLEKDVYNVSITFFGIFIALLLNIQVAVFSIFQRKWTPPADPRSAELQRERLAARKKLLSELNANISYLILFCCLALVLSLIFFAWQMTRGVPPALTALLYGHFLLTLVMVVKRSHALFQKEYDANSD